MACNEIFVMPCSSLCGDHRLGIALMPEINYLLFKLYEFSYAGTMCDQQIPVRLQNALLVDPSVVGQSHILVNTGIIRLATTRYSRVTIIAETTHCEAIKRYLCREIGDKVDFVTWRHRHEIVGIVQNFLAKKQIDQIIMTNISYRLFLYMNLFGVRASKNPIFWMFHSHFVDACGRDLRVRVKNFIKWYFLFRLFKNVRFIVLGERIRINIENSIGKFFHPDKISVINHPIGISRIPRVESDVSESLPKSVRILFMYGWHGLSIKNNILLEEIKKLSSTTCKFKLSVLSNEFKKSNNERSFSIDYAERLKEISKCDLFLYLPNDSYRLQASGATMDMLLTNTPMIGLRTEFGEELAELIGPFGYFFDTQSDLLQFLHSKNYDSVEISQFRANLTAGYDKILAICQAQFDRIIGF
ncbi:hypothetical protein FV228_21795 [Methylobacterium sp. WL18]|uniref:hypothetical protein n=1 Tax=Methylobacterium sp. WL18 TaxID=2603897 RepID=UPI0011CBD8B0|nr:hypothetical protein [Methylobacterium sp. WL18]TXN61066.1 hypothetical protein FV228_21795 [Methylobacterium sp. WL18]